MNIGYFNFRYYCFLHSQIAMLLDKTISVEKTPLLYIDVFSSILKDELFMDAGCLDSGVVTAQFPAELRETA